MHARGVPPKLWDCVPFPNEASVSRALKIGWNDRPVRAFSGAFARFSELAFFDLSQKFALPANGKTFKIGQVGYSEKQIWLVRLSMELRHLRYFLAVARERNFSEAAKTLHIAQPPLSRQIKQLEEELGVQLLDRSARPLVLTEAGEFFRVHAQQLLARLDDISSETHRIGRGSRRRIGIGFVPSMLYGFLPEAMRRFRLENPDVEVVLSELTTIQQMEALKAGHIDIGIGRLQIDDGEITSDLILEEPLVVALPASHPLLRRDALRLVHLASETLILYPAKPRPSFADHVLKLFRECHIEPETTVESNEMQTALGMVAAGVGITLVPASVQKLQREDVAYRRIADRCVTSPVTLSRRIGPSSDLQENFVRLVHSITSAASLPRAA